MLSDIVIAQAAKMLPIAKVAEKLGLTDEDLIPYGRYKAKINHKLIHSDRPDGKLILMTAISPSRTSSPFRSLSLSFKIL